MNNNLKDILSNSNKDINDQQLIDYLRQQISEADNHTVEKGMADDPFTNDAVEGLQNIEKKKDLPLYVAQLNNDFQKQLNKSKKRTKKRMIKNQTYTYFAVLLVILLLVICINLLRKNYQRKLIPNNKSAISQNTKLITRIGP